MARKQPVVVVDSVNNGIEWEMFSAEAGEVENLLTRQKVPGAVGRLRSRYAVRVANPLHELEIRLQRLSERGVLRQTTVLFGLREDPFYPFEGKFDGSLKLLELLSRYQPGLVIVVTRSPLLVIGLPMLKRLGNRVNVHVPIETNIRGISERYLPGQPDLAEREKLIRTLTHFHISVTASVRCLLPYGDWRKEARAFAQYLATLKVPISIGHMPIDKYTWESDRRASELLALDRRFFFLRSDAKEPLRKALLEIDGVERREPLTPADAHHQLSLFSARQS